MPHNDLVKRLREDQPVTQDWASTAQCALQDEAADRIAALEAEVARLRDALTPSGETKAAYISEVDTECPGGRPHVVSWNATKEIMKMIRARAALQGDKP